MKSTTLYAAVCATVLLSAGCAHYRIGNPVPRELRQVAVPVFENASTQPESEALVTQAVCREFLREGSMKLTGLDQAAVKVTGRVTEFSLKPVRYSHTDTDDSVEYRVHMVAVVTVIEKSSGNILLKPTTLTADTNCLTRGDLSTAKRDALHRVSHEISRQVVQAVIAIW